VLVLGQYDRQQFRYSMTLNGERFQESTVQTPFLFPYLQDLPLAFLQERSERDKGEFLETTNWQS